MVEGTLYRYIVEDEAGDAFIQGTRISVAQVGASLTPNYAESDIERLVSLFPQGYLSIAKLHSALAYYFDHEEIMKRQCTTTPPNFERNKNGNLVLHG